MLYGFPFAITPSHTFEVVLSRSSHAWPLLHPSPSHARRLHVFPSARGARALEPERLVVEAVGVGVVEADGLGVVAQDEAVVLREGGAERASLF